MKIKITSDGTPFGTEVKTDTGEILGQVQEISWHLTVDGFAKATIILAKVPVELSLEAKDCFIFQGSLS